MRKWLQLLAVALVAIAAPRPSAGAVHAKARLRIKQTDLRNRAGLNRLRIRTAPRTNSPTPNAAPIGQIVSRSEKVPVPTPELVVSPTFFAVHSGRVQNDLFIFQPVTSVLLTPPTRPREKELADGGSGDAFTFMPPRTENPLDIVRERDRLLLFREPSHKGTQTGVGLAMFSAMTVMAAHAPQSMRFIFDRRIHLGPAIFDAGGMGIGVGSRWM